ncbi:MAG: SPFH/Band 7/PHB domain protein [Burkholderiales bacterium]|jgi:regulator of protease activity HflC (stomatin/prohibitin superfamily)|nr:SPFH/Band 7/PHB domain protein [Burkholderiales bacterium]
MNVEALNSIIIQYGVLIAFIFCIVIFVKSSIKIIPQERVGIVERLGKFHSALNPGLHILVPFVDRLVVIHDMREVPMVVPEQVCITKDNTQLAIDGVVYFQISDAKLATYGTNNFVAAIVQLSQTTLRSVIGKMELDKTFEERDEINKHVVAAVDQASLNWGVKVLRYELKNIQPPQHILNAMQEQITAEREKRAKIARSEGDRQEKINLAEGDTMSTIRRSEGDKQSAINKAIGEAEAMKTKAQGEAQAILAIAEANAGAIKLIADAICNENGELAVNQKLAAQYIEQFGNLAKVGNTIILPQNLTDIAGVVTTALAAVKQSPTKS